MANRNSRRKAKTDRSDHKAGRTSSVVNHSPMAYQNNDDAIARRIRNHPSCWRSQKSPRRA